MPNTSLPAGVVVSMVRVKPLDNRKAQGIGSLDDTAAHGRNYLKR